MTISAHQNGVTTFHNLPPASLCHGLQYLVTDLGATGTTVQSNGDVWLPVIQAGQPVSAAALPLPTAENSGMSVRAVDPVSGSAQWVTSNGLSWINDSSTKPLRNTIVLLGDSFTRQETILTGYQHILNSANFWRHSGVGIWEHINIAIGDKFLPIAIDGGSSSGATPPVNNYGARIDALLAVRPSPAFFYLHTSVNDFASTNFTNLKRVQDAYEVLYRKIVAAGMRLITNKCCVGTAFLDTVAGRTAWFSFNQWLDSYVRDTYNAIILPFDTAYIDNSLFGTTISPMHPPTDGNPIGGYTFDGAHPLTPACFAMAKAAVPVLMSYPEIAQLPPWYTNNGAFAAGSSFDAGDSLGIIANPYTLGTGGLLSGVVATGQIATGFFHAETIAPTSTTYSKVNRAAGKMGQWQSIDFTLANTGALIYLQSTLNFNIVGNPNISAGDKIVLLYDFMYDPVTLNSAVNQPPLPLITSVGGPGLNVTFNDWGNALQDNTLAGTITSEVFTVDPLNTALGVQFWCKSPYVVGRQVYRISNIRFANITKILANNQFA